MQQKLHYFIKGPSLQKSVSKFTTIFYEIYPQVLIFQHIDFSIMCWLNDFWSNDVWSNDVWPNDFWPNDFWPNDFWPNDFWPNDFWSNAVVS
jgi:hypothetical protein